MAIINVIKNDDGYWIHFCDDNHNSAMIHANKMLKTAGPIVKKAILKTCEQLTQKGMGNE